MQQPTQDAPDTWLLLRALAKDGLEQVAIEVRFDKAPVVITDLALELAEDDATPADAIPEALRASVRAARALSELTPEDIAEIRLKAMAGEDGSQRLYQALVLRQLVRSRLVARRLVARIAQGDEAARRGAELIFQAALEPGPRQARARVSAFLIRDAMLAAQRAAKAQAAAAAAAAEPSPRAPGDASTPAPGDAPPPPAASSTSSSSSSEATP